MVVSRRRISPEDAALYEQRWSIVRRRLSEELRSTSMEAKLRRVAALMASSREIGWSRSLDEEDDAARKTWMALRRATLGQA